MRLAVGKALWNLRDCVTDKQVEQVAEGLDHQCDRYRATTALAIGSIGEAKAGKYIPVLKKMLRTNVYNQGEVLAAPNCAAAVALGRMGVEADTLAWYLASKNAAMRMSTCEGLALM